MPRAHIAALGGFALNRITGTVIVVVVLIIAVLLGFYFYQHGSVVDVSRQGDNNATLHARLPNGCGDVPSNIDSASSSAFEAAISKAFKSSHGGDLDARVKAELASALKQTPASSQTANDLNALVVTACRVCLANGLSVSACVKLGMM